MSLIALDLWFKFLDISICCISMNILWYCLY